MEKCQEYNITLITGLPTCVFVTSESCVMPQTPVFPYKREYFKSTHHLAPFNNLYARIDNSEVWLCWNEPLRGYIYSFLLTLFGFSYISHHLSVGFRCFSTCFHFTCKITYRTTCKLLFIEIRIRQKKLNPIHLKGSM